MQIRELTPHLGSEVSGLDLASLSTVDKKRLHTLFRERAVLVFRDQHLTRDQHKAFGREFGELHIHPSKRDLDTKSDPEIFAIKTRPDSVHTNGEAWHTDVSCDAVPPLGSMLYMKDMPGPSGGDTLFANMYLAFATLSEKMQAFLRPLEAVHDGRKDLRTYNITLEPGQTYPRAVHPVVTVHPETGREVLFVNRAFTESIEGLSRHESDALLEMLWHYVESDPRFHLRVQWQPGTLVFWDNRCTWHHAVWDYFPNARYAERVTVAADSAPSRDNVAPGLTASVAGAAGENGQRLNPNPPLSPR